MERAVWRWCGLIHLALVACSQASRDYAGEPGDGGPPDSSQDASHASHSGDDGGASKHDASVESRPSDAGTRGEGWSSVSDSGASVDGSQTASRDASAMSHDGSAD